MGGAGVGTTGAVGANAAKAVAVEKNPHRRDVVVAGADPGTGIDCFSKQTPFMTVLSNEEVIAEVIASLTLS